MKREEALQNDYQKFIDYLNCGVYGFTFDELDSYSVEELETMANFGWSDEVSEELYEIIMRRRKRKLNEKFVFNQDTIPAIIELNNKLADYCRELKNETEDLYSRMQQLNWSNFTISGQVIIQGGEPFIDCALTTINDNLLSFSISSGEGIEQLNLFPIFNFHNNYADKILSYNTQRAAKVFDEARDCHIGYAFYLLYRKSCLSFQDMLGICGLQKEINIHYYSDVERICDEINAEGE